MSKAPQDLVRCLAFIDAADEEWRKENNLHPATNPALGGIYEWNRFRRRTLERAEAALERSEADREPGSDG